MRQWGIFLLLFLTAALPVQASFSFQISSIFPDSITATDQEIQVHLSISDLPSSSYFRAAFQKSSGDPYFGQVKNNSGSWVDIQALSADCKNYFYIDDTATTSAVLTIRIGQSSYNPGTYQVKAHRFTSTSCSYTEAANTQVVNFNFLSPTSTPAPTSTPSATTPPTHTPKPPTSTPSPRPPSPTPQPTGQVTIEPSLSVLSASSATLPTSSPTPKPISNQSNYLGFAFIAAGLVCLALSAFLLMRSRKPSVTIND